MAGERSTSGYRVRADLRFESTLREVASFLRDRAGALPSAASDHPDEVRLARWLAKRRWEDRAGMLTATRVSMLNVVVPRWRETVYSPEGFAATLEECRRWRELNGRFPRSAGGGNDETRLGLWLTAPRYDARVGRLDELHARSLDERLDGWRATLPSTDRFHRAIAECAAWRHEHGRLPDDADASPRSRERVLASWLAGVRRAAAEGRLSGERRAQLAAFLPGWETGPRGSRDLAFDEALRRCADWVQIHGRVPRRTRHDEQERRIAVWLSNRRRDREQGRLSAEREAAILRVIPEWADGYVPVGAGRGGS